MTPTPAFEEAMAKYLDSLANINGFLSMDHRLDVLGIVRRLPGTASAVAALAEWSSGGG